MHPPRYHAPAPMTTVVVHGTMTVRAARNYRWWHASWDSGGFLEALADGMTRASGGHDVWAVRGRPVEEIQGLGFFTWSGAAAGWARDAGVSQLVDYLNTLSGLTDERLCVVAHSHGCNLVKNATSHKKFRGTIDQVAFLACPHFAAQGHRGAVYTYRLDPRRVGRILNLYTESDDIQTNVAAHFSGPPGARFADWLPPEASRWDTDPAARHLYEDVPVPVNASGQTAHSAMHGSLIGGLVGLWLGSGASFEQVLAGFGGPLPAVSADDLGE